VVCKNTKAFLTVTEIAWGWVNSLFFSHLCLFKWIMYTHSHRCSFSARCFRTSQKDAKVLVCPPLVQHSTVCVRREAMSFLSFVASNLIVSPTHRH